jgi:hypothetical protein
MWPTKGHRNKATGSVGVVCDNEGGQLSMRTGPLVGFRAEAPVGGQPRPRDGRLSLFQIFPDGTVAKN